MLIVYDTHIPEDMRYLPLLVAQYNGTVDRLFFNEGAAISSSHEPSYGHNQLWRPGRWGVLHVARFDLGLHRGVLPPPLPRDLVEKIHMQVRPNWNWEEFGWRAGTSPSVKPRLNVG